MRLRANITIKNDHMVSARKKKKLTQFDVVAMTGIPIHFISSLENLHYPVKYDEMQVTLLADILDLLPEQVFPIEMAAWKGITSFTTVEDVEIDKLMEYSKRQKSRFILPSPLDTAIHNEEEQLQIKKAKQTVEKLPYMEKEVIQLRYGLLSPHTPMTLEAISKILNITRERVRQIEIKALHNIQRVYIGEQTYEIH